MRTIPISTSSGISPHLIFFSLPMLHLIINNSFRLLFLFLKKNMFPGLCDDLVLEGGIEGKRVNNVKEATFRNSFKKY